LALVIGGALGNLIDRVWLGKVVDFLQWHWQQWYWPSFNLADSAITLGVVLLLFDGVVGWRREREARSSD
jgi:signal peptidase II